MTALLIIGVVGLALLAASLVLGDIFDGLLSGLDAGEFLSSAAISGFLSAFGFSGALALSAGAPTVVATGTGLVTGGLFAFGAVRLTRALSDDHTDATPTTGGLTGLPATVVSDVPSGGYGTVSLVIGGHMTRLSARSEEPLPAGTPVSVVMALSPTAVQVIRAESPPFR